MDHFDLDDTAFIEKFSTGKLDPQLFNHEAHLRLAFLVIDPQKFTETEDTLANLILDYVRTLGAEDKFNRTLTFAAAQIISNRKVASSTTDFHDFLSKNNDLKIAFLEVIQDFYSKEVLFSTTAKKGIVAPDLNPFD